MEPMRTTSGVAGASDPKARETISLIASDKVQGTPVRRTDGEKMGTIERVMIDKHSGRVAYAVMTFGGFLGLGQDYYPLPWQALTYDESLDAYRLDIPDERLRGAPKFAEATPLDRRWEKGIHDYYGLDPYW
jgi:PRC-barrel domain